MPTAVFSPEDCALLFATPVSHEEFYAACARTPRSDYIDQVLRGRTCEEAWNSTYWTVASAAQELIATANTLRAVVYREAALADLASATRRSRVVIPLAHLTGYAFSEQDLLVPPENVVAALQSHSEPVLARFRDVPSSELVDSFNAAISNLELLQYLPPMLVKTARRTPALGMVLSRDLLDETLKGLVRPGNQIDLMDGLQPLAAVEQVISASFDGELDLALCNSIAVSTYFDLRRKNNLHYLYWPEPIDPIPQFLSIAETLRRLARHNGSYIATRMSLDTKLRSNDDKLNSPQILYSQPYERHLSLFECDLV